MIELSLRKENEEVMKYFLNKEVTTIGRSSQNDICLPDSTISRTHLVITRTGDRYVVTDKSTNGTFVNDKKVTSNELKLNDVIRLGPWTIRFGAPQEGDQDQTQISERDPTRVLSYQLDKNELLLERAVLEISDGPRKRTIPITKAIFAIGKAKSSDLVLKDSYASNFHCKIENRRGSYFLKDLQSTNGTKLNGQKIIETAIDFGSTIEIGKTKIVFSSIEEQRRIEASKQTQFEGIHSQSPKMQKIFTLIDRVATADATILIHGESGTGKELVARALHNRSSRSKSPFVAINCGAISKDLIESELFGHEKGAFTSAHQQRKGVFEQAQRGTLFLDEIGELPQDLQPKLLRVLETGEIKRVGGTQLIDVDVRVVAATNRDLAKEVRKGRFREDLFFRLFVVPINLPPLRERPQDIPLLVNYFLKQEFASAKGAPNKKLDQEALDKLMDYHWPGNIRELKNVISRAVLECQTAVIGPGDLQFAPVGLKDQTAFEANSETGVTQTFTRTLQDVEKEKIIAELKRNNWSKKETAKVLGIAKSTLHEKIKKYGIEQS